MVRLLCCGARGRLWLLLARSGLLTMYTVCAHATTDVLSPLYGWLRFPVVRVRPVLVLQMHSTQEEGPGRRTALSLGEHGTARGQSFMTLEGDLDEVRCGVVSVRGATASGQVVSHCKCDARSLDFTVRVLYLHTLSSERLRTRSCHFTRCHTPTTRTRPSRIRCTRALNHVTARLLCHAFAAYPDGTSLIRSGERQRGDWGAKLRPATSDTRRYVAASHPATAPTLHTAIAYNEQI